MADIKLRDIVRIFGAIFALCLTHELLFDTDDFDVTQFWIAGFGFAILCALREKSHGV